jgi:ATP-dependent Lon protease
VKWIDRVLELALERIPAPLPEEEAVAVPAEAAAPAKAAPAAEAAGPTVVVKH